MATEDFKRKLAAVFSADVVGYSRMMGDNEAETVKTLETYKDVMFSLIKQHRGRVVDSTGDNLLAEFGSVVDAVQCAVAVQKELQTRNSDLPEERKMLFRIGINLGDVIEEKDRLYGDGVNIAARLEALADPGGICVSKTAFDHIESKLPLGYEFLGEQEVKNISKPVGAYKVLMETRVVGAKEKKETTATPFWRRKVVLSAGFIVILVIIAGLVWKFNFRPSSIEKASKEKMALELPDKPSIAVLPFVNMSDDPKQEYFSDGITEEIISALSRISKLFVIARTSSFKYKGRRVDVRTVGRELGVRYILEGSVRRADDEVRITVQLIDAAKGQHVWSERYDRDLREIFALQDEITMKIAAGLQLRLTDGEQARLWSRKNVSLEAYLKGMEAWAYWNKGTSESLARFGRMSQELIDMAPESDVGYRNLAWYYWGLEMRSARPNREHIEKCFELAKKAISMDESYPFNHALLGHAYLLMRQYDKGVAAGQRSVELDPNGATVHGLFGVTLSYVGRLDEAIFLLKKGIRLNPFPEYWYFFQLGRCYGLNGQYEEAIAEMKKALLLAPGHWPSHLVIASACARLGREEEARAAAKKVLEINPYVSLAHIRASVAKRYKTHPDVEGLIESLRNAGIPE